MLLMQLCLILKSLFATAPGLYNGDATSVNYNPLSGILTKVVVQQKEQERLL
jgi:hypothetical protein